MITTITGYLTEKGLLPDDYNYDVNIFMGRNNFFHFFLPKGKSLAVKVADSKSDCAKSLIKEYGALQENHPRYRELLPHGIALEEGREFTIMVTEGMIISSITLDEILSVSGTQRDLMQKFLCGEDRILPDEGIALRSFTEVLETAIEMLPRELCQKYKKVMTDRKWGEFLRKLPAIPQHGDLAINNIGKTDNGLVIFDWEDYGYVTIPGFDLCVLLVSGCQFNKYKLTGIINDIYSGDEGHCHILTPVVNTLRIDQQHFTDLVSIHLILFHKLKYDLGYGHDVIENCQSLLQALHTERPA
ncbi:MAG: aminoglycoside phosphotransferase family protein [Emcibacter sp.]|nr:aminoglycoside phosphotransferase family protein [Emcibacter sp.]